MATLVTLPSDFPLSEVKLIQVDASVFANAVSFVSYPMYPAPGAGSVTHCSGIDESAPCARDGDTRATAISSTENLPMRFMYSPVSVLFKSDQRETVPGH